jgi:hypothetical protein
MSDYIYPGPNYSVTPVVELLKETLPDLHIALLSGVP